MMKPRILVAEADEPIRNDIVTVLESANYHCLKAANSSEALAFLQSGEDFDLMLAGIAPATQCYMLIAEAKERFPDMPVIVVTAMNDISVALNAIRKGAYDYLLKPFDRDDLLNTAGRGLENYRLKLESRAYQANLEGLVTSRTEQLRQAVRTLERSYAITLEALGNALALKQAEPKGHSRRVAAFTVAIARTMGLDADRIRVIARGAFLHDIGKIAVPDPILLKPGPLDSEEFAIVREHCFRGYQILRCIPFLSEAAEIVYCHHENYDGSGYPRHLKGNEIPIGARIVAVANSLDTITSDRPYRAARSIGAAKEEIRRCAGRQFDPTVVTTFASMPENIWADLKAGIKRQGELNFQEEPTIDENGFLVGTIEGLERLVGKNVQQQPPPLREEPRGPVPEVDPEDLRTLWREQHELQARHAGEHVAIAMDVAQQMCKPGADIEAVFYRSSMIWLLSQFAKEKFAPWITDKQVSDVVFRTMSKIPMEWLGHTPRRDLPFDVEEFFRRVSGGGA